MAARLNAMFLLVTLLVGPTMTQLPDCFDPTACDTSLASCTVGLDCLGSSITMCAVGELEPNGACQTFENAPTVNYCECNTCIGLINSVLYTCSCDTTGDYECPNGMKLVACKSILYPLISGIQYSCCNEITDLVSC